MNTEQYKAFWKSASIALPRIAEFFTVADFRTNRPLTEEEAAERHGLWKQVLLLLDFDDCKQALIDMVGGVIDPPGFDCSDFPAKIRRQAREYGAKRAKELSNSKQRDAIRGGKKWSLSTDGECLRAFLYITIRGKELMGDVDPRKSHWQWCDSVHEAMEEIWPEGTSHPKFPDDATIPIPAETKLLQGVE